jgi:hypothetical protein
MGVQGDGNSLGNSGSILTRNVLSHGLAAVGNGNSLANGGTITTESFDSDGLHVEGDQNSLVNSGTITTHEEGARGIFAVGNGNSLGNSGSITTMGLFYANGIYASGDGSSLTNSGSISTEGINSVGMIAEGSSNSLQNSGSITTSGEGSSGLYGDGDGNSFANSGSVSVTGFDAHGLLAYGDGITAINSGTLSSTEGTSVSFYGSSASLALLENSVLIGDVFFSDPGSTTLAFGPGLSAVVQTDASVPATILAANGVAAVTGNTVLTADTTDYAAQDVMGAGFGRMLADAVPAFGGDVQVTQGMGGTGGWAQVFGGSINSGADADFAAWSGFTGGVVAGRDGSNGTGFFGGAAGQYYATSNGDAFETHATALFGGVYGSVGQAGYSLAFGLIQTDTTREVANNALPTGLETASADYLSIFVAPSVTIDGLLGQASRLRLRYMATWHEAHSYDFTQGDLSVGERLSHAVEARLDFRHALGDAGQLRYGLDGTYLASNGIDLMLGGTPFEVSSAAEGWSGRAFFGFDAGAGHFEVGYDTEERVTASLGIHLTF